MLYATTRSKTDTYTDYRTLFEDRAPNEGFFVPFRMPRLNADQITGMQEKSFGETVADVLNLFYSGRITSWDVDCSIGKMPVKTISADHKVLLATLWDNPQGHYFNMCNRIYDKLSEGNGLELTEWANIAIRISFLFGLYGILQKMQIKTFDISVNSIDFSLPLAAWYARYMGLPVRKIICTCNDTSPIWEFFHRGELNTAMLGSESCVERLIYTVLGIEEVQKYMEISAQQGIYHISAEQLKLLNQDVFISVVGKNRSDSAISSFYAANDVLLDPYAAASYCGLQDYRSKTGESILTVMLSDFSPAWFSFAIEKATGLTKQEIRKQCEKI